MAKKKLINAIYNNFTHSQDIYGTSVETLRPYF